MTSPVVEDMAGLGFTHLRMWSKTGYAGCPTYYWANPAYRSEEEFEELARNWHTLGGHLGVYYHGNGMSRSYIEADKIYGIPVSEIPENKRPPSWDWFVRNHAYDPERTPIEKLDMNDIPEPAKKEEYSNMNWQAGDWHSYLKKWAIYTYLGEYGLETLYGHARPRNLNAGSEGGPPSDP